MMIYRLPTRVTPAALRNSPSLSDGDLGGSVAVHMCVSMNLQEQKTIYGGNLLLKCTVKFSPVSTPHRIYILYVYMYVCLYVIHVLYTFHS